MLMDVLYPTPPFSPTLMRDVMETLRLFHFLASDPCCQIDQNHFSNELLNNNHAGKCNLMLSCV